MPLANESHNVVNIIIIHIVGYQNWKFFARVVVVVGFWLLVFNDCICLVFICSILHTHKIRRQRKKTQINDATQ